MARDEPEGPGGSPRDGRVRGIVDSIVRDYGTRGAAGSRGARLEPDRRSEETSALERSTSPRLDRGDAPHRVAGRGRFTRRTRPSVVFGAVGAIALLAAALIVLSGRGHRGPAAGNAVTRAAYVTSTEPGYRAAFTLTGSLGTHGFVINGSGALTQPDHRGRLTVVEAGRSINELIAYPNVYLRTPTGLNGAPIAPTPWIEMNMASVYRALGVNVSPIGSSDPSELVDLLRTARRVTGAGEERVRGVATTEYRAVVDLDKYPSFVPASLSAAARQNAAVLKRWTGASTFPIEAWVDGRERVRRVQFQLSICSRLGKLSEVMSMEFFGYGLQPSVAPPASAQVTDVTAAVTSNTSQLFAALAPGCPASRDGQNARPLRAVATSAAKASGGGSSAPRAIARAINLHASDLPGFTAQPPDHSGTGSQIGSRMKGCLGAGWIAQHTGGDLVDVSSPQFASGSGLQAEQVSSDVTIKRSTSLVRRDLAVIQSGRIQGCLGQALDGITIPTQSGPTVTIDHVRAARLAAAGQGSDGSFGIRTTMSMSALGVNVPVTLDILGYAVGRDELSLVTFTIARPFSAQIERQLAAVLISRALAHPH